MTEVVLARAVLLHVDPDRTVCIAETEENRPVRIVLGLDDADEIVVVQDEVVDERGLAGVAAPARLPTALRTVPALDEGKVRRGGGDLRAARTRQVGRNEVHFLKVARGADGERDRLELALRGRAAEDVRDDAA